MIVSLHDGSFGSARTSRTGDGAPADEIVAGRSIYQPSISTFSGRLSHASGLGSFVTVVFRWLAVNPNTFFFSPVSTTAVTLVICPPLCLPAAGAAGASGVAAGSGVTR